MKRCIFIYLFVLSFSLGYSQNSYQKDALTILADSLHLKGEYEQAIAIRKQAIQTQNNASADYQTYLKVKFFHTNSASMEFKSYDYHNVDKTITKKVREQYLDSALQSAIRARDLYSKEKYPDKIFQYQIQNRIYHQTAYLGNWKHALEQAQLGYDVLKDTLSNKDKSFVDLIYDIGFIHSKLGDYSKAVENYQTSLDLYKSVIGENNTDVAQAYNNIAVEYRYLGLKRKELESLLKAKTIWETLDENGNQHFLYRCYGNLFYWYSYYGDFDKAEEYILKKDKLRLIAKTTKANLLLRNKEEIYEDKLSNWYDLMLHYSRKKDTINTVFYTDTILKTIDSSKKLSRFEVNTLSSTLKFKSSLITHKNPEEALQLLDKAIAINENYKTVYYTKSFGYKLYKAELLLERRQFNNASVLLNDLEEIKDNEETSSQFKLAILRAKTALALHQKAASKRYFDDAFMLLNNSNKDINDLTVEHLKPLISFETIAGFLAMGDFYFELYKKENIKADLEKATHRYIMASEIYNQLYLGQRYNESLFTNYNAINEGLLKVALEQPNDISLLSKILNTIENNGSKLTWSKFVFNNQRQQLKIPENFISREDHVKAQLNFYQKALIDIKDDSEDKKSLWQDKIYELKNDLIKLQDSIKQQNQTYYQFNVQKFDITSLQADLKDREGVLKYIFTDAHLYAFLITNTNIEILPIVDKSTVLNALKEGLNVLKQRTPNYHENLRNVSSLLLHQIDYQDYINLIIIPDGAIHYLPFEALILNQKMPLVSYASSLLLYQEQKKITSTFSDVKIGAFSASNTTSKLPKVSREINSILNIFDGVAYLNASKSDFENNANDFNVLHLAMHSKIDEVHPEFSSLSFYGVDDNQLFISELYNETLRANMVVLSACDTGSGFYENGEGVISLSRAFNYAGIPSTVMSLWKVDDEATATIMTYFYSHLKCGEFKDEALKNAKLDYLENTDDELLKHPYYWSGFVITGNTDALVETHNYWFFLLIIPFIIVILFRKQLFQFFKK
ncbi:kinesin light chain-like protein [Winogradskyella psychrotolerans RS-3]|uniref:Kinesin light chain-like protein n=1 Tax=Winogradskyella psychrotolerans RS-3 TaxID=641526 RepID=S7X2T8_9FLAO|nr:CHAT domain-containing protein [Winogradskyella psychrotolerans]EPR73339.1 kinesin light chain-like protein [Winogradskyella psychrotolerans RS-3]